MNCDVISAEFQDVGFQPTDESGPHQDVPPARSDRERQHGVHEALQIHLVREVPEAMKPRRIAIDSGKAAASKQIEHQQAA